MIPKVIHYCWLSDGPMPDSVHKYIESWQRVLPDYEIRKWDFERFPKDKSIWVSEAFDARKYAFAADYIRCYALYTEGGIYFDSDVEAVKSFDPLLHLPYFLGQENSSGHIEAAVMGSEPGNPIYKLMLDYYEGRHFVNPDGSFNTTPLPHLLTEMWSPKYNIKEVKSIDEYDTSPGVLSVLPFDYFSPIHIETKRLESTSRTMAIHRFAASWVTGWPKYKKMIKTLVGPAITGWLISAKRAIVGKK